VNVKNTLYTHEDVIISELLYSLQTHNQQQTKTVISFPGYNPRGFLDDQQTLQYHIRLGNKSTNHS